MNLEISEHYLFLEICLHPKSVEKNCEVFGFCLCQKRNLTWKGSDVMNGAQEGTWGT